MNVIVTQCNFTLSQYYNFRQSKEDDRGSSVSDEEETFSEKAGQDSDSDDEQMQTQEQDGDNKETETKNTDTPTENEVFKDVSTKQFSWIGASW